MTRLETHVVALARHVEALHDAHRVVARGLAQAVKAHGCSDGEARGRGVVDLESTVSLDASAFVLSVTPSPPVSMRAPYLTISDDRPSLVSSIRTASHSCSFSSGVASVAMFHTLTLTSSSCTWLSSSLSRDFAMRCLPDIGSAHAARGVGRAGIQPRQEAIRAVRSTGGL